MLSETDKIRHLYNRAGFGMTIQTTFSQSLEAIQRSFLDSSNDYTSLQAVTLAEVAEVKQQMKSASKQNVKDIKQQLKKNIFELNNLWLDEMINSKSQLREKMALFWHGHFACRSANPYFDQQYLDIIRRHALGNFGELLQEITKAPAMLQFLNNQQNRKDHPNENFAREVMELFTLGRGNYNEKDVKEAARAFTGFGFDVTGQFKFKTHQHDFGTKTFLGQTGNYSGEDILKILLEKKRCANFIASKVYAFFVNDNPDEAIVTTLGESFYQSGYDIKALLEKIFTAPWFYEEKNIGVKIKSPVEYMAGMFRIVPTDFDNDQSTLFIQRSLGQVLLNPPGVAGWAGGRAWIDSSSLLFRMRLPQVLYYDKELDFSPKEEIPEEGSKMMKMADAYIKTVASKKLSAKSDWSKVQQRFADSKDVVNDIPGFILSNPANATVASCIRNNCDTSSKENQVRSVMIDVLSLPEYQLH